MKDFMQFATYNTQNENNTKGYYYVCNLKGL